MREASKCLDCSHFWRSNRSQPDRNVCECECEGLLVFGNVTKTGDKAVDNYVHPSIGKPLCRFCSSSRAGERALRSSDRPTDRPRDRRCVSDLAKLDSGTFLPLHVPTHRGFAPRLVL